MSVNKCTHVFLHGLYDEGDRFLFRDRFFSPSCLFHSFSLARTRTRAHRFGRLFIYSQSRSLAEQHTRGGGDDIVSSFFFFVGCGAGKTCSRRVAARGTMTTGLIMVINYFTRCSCRCFHLERWPNTGNTYVLGFFPLSFFLLFVFRFFFSFPRRRRAQSPLGGTDRPTEET